VTIFPSLKKKKKEDSTPDISKESPNPRTPREPGNPR
jgi:hypothetical protein